MAEQQRLSVHGSLGIIILAGGRSRRMNCNKVFLEIRGEPLIRRVVRMASEVSRKMVVAIGMQDRVEDFTSILPEWVSVVRDTNEDKAALFGVLTGLESIKADYAVVLAADLPFVNPEVIRRLHREAEGFDLAIPSWSDGDIEPLYAVYKVSSARIVFKEAVRVGEVRMRDAIKRLKRANYVSVEKFRDVDPLLRCFMNINTPENLRMVEDVLRGGGVSGDQDGR